MEQKISFSFGRNWQNFLKSLNDEQIEIAQESLTEFLGQDDLKGKTFLDIGCGSGLFSLAAYNLGAARVVSFDIDPFSVQCCRYLREQANSPDTWEVSDGSVLDDAFLQRLEPFDLVYSWGVLHHTGRMWNALERSLDLVAPGGQIYLALYNKILARDNSTSWIHSFWLAVKRFHNTHPSIGAYVLEPLAMAAYLGIVVARLENPITHLRNYKSHRGMSWQTDATDWLGGYPYEFATVEEVFTFVKRRKPEFNLENLKVTSGRGLNWYLFRRG